jgi:hypothetical protein
MTKRIFTIIAIVLLTNSYLKAQVGIGTTSPNSTLDVRGSLSVSYRAFASSTSAAISDNTLVFTGTSAATLTLPDATACTGRVYWVKNVSSNTSVLTIATTSAQTIDGLSTWTLGDANGTVAVVSNGTNWYVSAQVVPNNTGGGWNQGGNTLTAIKNFGTISNHDLPFITNNTEYMRLSATGSLGVGTSTFDGTNPEKLLVDAGTTTSFNAIAGKGNINNYLQLNIQNRSNGTSASSDVVATSDNGNETVNYVDMGINSSTNSGAGILGGANNAYLYSTGNDFIIGDGTANKNLIFFTGGTTAANEKMRLTANGMTVTGGLTMSYHSGTGNYTLLATDYVVINTGAASTWTLPVATTCAGRVYRLLNQGTGTMTLSQTVRTASGTTVTTLVVTAGSNFLEILSDGVEWRRIN